MFPASGEKRMYTGKYSLMVRRESDVVDRGGSLYLEVWRTRAGILYWRPNDYGPPQTLGQNGRLSWDGGKNDIGGYVYTCQVSPDGLTIKGTVVFTSLSSGLQFTGPFTVPLWKRP